MAYKDLEKKRAYYRAWRALNLELARAATRDWRERNKEHLAEYKEANIEKFREYCRKSSQKRREAGLGIDTRTRRGYSQVHGPVHKAVEKAVKLGVLIRPESCFKCGKRGRIHGHHHNGYDSENRLNVQWLCTACHGIAHRLGLPSNLPSSVPCKKK